MTDSNQELVDALTTSIITWFENRTGFQISRHTEDVDSTELQAYYGGNWITFDAAKLAAHIAEEYPLSQPTAPEPVSLDDEGREAIGRLDAVPCIEARLEAHFDNEHDTVLLKEDRQEIAEVIAPLFNLTRPAQSGEQGPWRGMESAPKDGTAFLAAIGPLDDGSWRITRMHWMKNRTNDSGLFHEVFVEMALGKGHVKDNQPSRWQPLPTPPTDTAEAQGNGGGKSDD